MQTSFDAISVDESREDNGVRASLAQVARPTLGCFKVWSMQDERVTKFI